MIRNNQLWVCEVETDEGVKLASICGVTRWTNTTATISKVFTAVNCRKRGFAEHLVRHVTEQCVFLSRCLLM